MGARAHALSSVLSLDGGGERDRTDDLLLAKQALSQLSYTPSSFDTRRLCSLLRHLYGSAIPLCGLPSRLDLLDYRVWLDTWWVWLGSNQRPPPYQDGALTD